MNNPSNKLFTYGSLMCDDIMHRVAGDCTTMGRATLENYRCLAVRDEDYPAIVKKDGYCTRGTLYDSITPEGFVNLDDFEGEMYERIVVTVTSASGQSFQAYTYVFRPQFAHLLTDTEWEFDEFLKSGKSAFVDKYVGFSKI